MTEQCEKHHYLMADGRCNCAPITSIYPPLVRAIAKLEDVMCSLDNRGLIDVAEPAEIDAYLDAIEKQVKSAFADIVEEKNEIELLHGKDSTDG